LNYLRQVCSINLLNDFIHIFFFLAYPEFGFYVTKQSDQFVSTPNTWTKLNNWVVSSQFSGVYNYDSQLENNEYVVVPITGIYYASGVVPIDASSTSAEYSLALVNNDVTVEDQIGLKSTVSKTAGRKATLAISGFVKLFAGEKITLEVKGSAGFEVDKAATFSFHFIGPPGAVPAYLGQVNEELTVPSGQIIKPFITEGRAKLYRSLSGEN
jgi:hypothetical protein